MNFKAMNKQNPEKYIMVANEFGYDMYVAPLRGLDIDVTDKKEDAQLWGYADTQSAVKLAFHNKITGFTFRWVKI